MNQIKKRRITDHDAQDVAGVGIALVKVGVAAAASVAIGPTAGIGALVVYELTGFVLESQRERLADIVSRFNKRTAELPLEAQDRIREQLGTDAGSRIFESAWHQAAEEVDPEKLDFIAALLKNSLSSEVLREHQTRWLLKILNDLDIVQIVILQSFANQNRDSDFRHRHHTIFEDEKHPEPPHFVHSRPCPKFSSRFAPLKGEEKVIAEQYQDEFKRELEIYQSKLLPAEQEKYELARERHSLYRSRVHALVERGLLGVTRNDNTFGSHLAKVSEDLTPLGAALLKIIDAIDPSEWGQGEQVNAVQAIQQSLVDIERNTEKERKEMIRAFTP